MKIVTLAKQGAALRFRGLLNELDVLLSSFPHLQDAFDADELPLSFIVRREVSHPAIGRDLCRPAHQKVRPLKPPRAATKKGVRRQPTPHWADRRAGRMK